MRNDHAIGLAAALTLLVPGVAGAQPSDPGMGAQARATVRITVSVVPRFRLKDPRSAAESPGGTSEAPGGMTIASNAGVRYQLIEDPAQGAGMAATPVPADAKGSPLRLLVVPD